MHNAQQLSRLRRLFADRPTEAPEDRMKAATLRTRYVVTSPVQFREDIVGYHP
jgi:hypothetical protein